jgi:hypothetical protein
MAGLSITVTDENAAFLEILRLLGGTVHPSAQAGKISSRVPVASAAPIVHKNYVPIVPTSEDEALDRVLVRCGTGVRGYIKIIANYLRQTPGLVWSIRRP